MNFAAFFFIFTSTIIICASSTDLKSNLDSSDPTTNEVDGKVPKESEEPSWWQDFKSTVTGWLMKNRDLSTPDPWVTTTALPETSSEPPTSWDPPTSSEPPLSWPSTSSEPPLSWPPTSSEPPLSWPSTSSEPPWSWDPPTSSEPPMSWESSTSWNPPETSSAPPGTEDWWTTPSWTPSYWWTTPSWTPSYWWSPTSSPSYDSTTWWPTWTWTPTWWGTTPDYPGWLTTSPPPPHTDTIICKNSPRFVDKNLDEGNYGDIICIANDYTSRLDTLIIRDTVINYQDESSVRYLKNLNDTVISRVNVLNFGRQHGLASSVHITNEFDGTRYKSSVDVKIQIPALEEVRLFVEIYGTMRYW